METIIENLKDDLLNFLIKSDFSINENSLNILIGTEIMCYQRNIDLFSSDLLLSLIREYSELGELINKYDGNSALAIEVIGESFEREYEKREKYYVNNYSDNEVNNIRYLLIDKCMKYAKENNRFEINEVDIILSVLDLHDEDYPPYDNGAYFDDRFHTPFNTLSHIFGDYSEHLWVKNDDIRWEFTNFNNRNYDIAISFAGEDRKIAEEIAGMLSNAGKRVFYDNFERANLWGKDLYTYLSEIYSDRAKFCLMIVSKNYAIKHWPNLERQAAQAKAFSEQHEYILPLRIDDTRIPGILPTTGYIDIRNTTITEVVNLIIEKLQRYNK